MGEQSRETIGRAHWQDAGQLRQAHRRGSSHDFKLGGDYLRRRRQPGGYRPRSCRGLPPRLTTTFAPTTTASGFSVCGTTGRSQHRHPLTSPAYIALTDGAAINRRLTRSESRAYATPATAASKARLPRGASTRSGATVSSGADASGGTRNCRSSRTCRRDSAPWHRSARRRQNRSSRADGAATTAPASRTTSTPVAQSFHRICRVTRCARPERQQRLGWPWDRTFAWTVRTLPLHAVTGATGGLARRRLINPGDEGARTSQYASYLPVLCQLRQQLTPAADTPFGRSRNLRHGRRPLMPR